MIARNGDKLILFMLCLALLPSCQLFCPRSKLQDQSIVESDARGGRRAPSASPVAQAGRSAIDDWTSRPPIRVSRRAFDGQLSSLQFHANYLVMSLPFLFMRPVYDDLKSRVDGKLISRGESHVTVMTPPEEALLAAVGITQTMIDAVAAQKNIQQAELIPFCLGMGQAILDGKTEKTYFIVVQARQLLDIRRSIGAIVQKPSSGASIEAGHFFAHVTVGFTRRDLFEQDGVIKDAASCIFPLELIP